jgi:type II secretory pathway component PulF
MAVFTYRAMDLSSAEARGTITADTPRQARDLLRDRGLIVKEVADYKPVARRRPIRPRFGRGGQAHEFTDFLWELATLLGVGMPLLAALETIASQHRGRFALAVTLLRDRVAAGSSLAGAMREQPNLFDELSIALTEVGEDAGTLDASLQRLAEFRERSQQLKGRIATALLYPALVLTMAILAGTFLMTFVVPRIIEPLIEQGQPMPLPTRVVKSASDFLVAWGWLLLLGAVGVAAAFAAALRSPRGRLKWHRFVLWLPLIGDLARKQAVVRMAVVISTLLKSGIVFLRAVQIAQTTTSNLVLRDALARCQRAVTAGSDIAAAMDESGAFSPMVVQIFALGQQSGRMEEMLDRLAGVYDQQVSTASQRLTAVLEPMLIILLALVVLLIVAATVLPILEAGNAIQ